MSINRRDFLKGTLAAGAASVLMLPGPKKAKLIPFKPEQIQRYPGYEQITTGTRFDDLGGFRRQGITLISGGVGDGKSLYGGYLAARAVANNDITAVMLTEFDHHSSRIHHYIGPKSKGKFVLHRIDYRRTFFETLKETIGTFKPDLIFDDVNLMHGTLSNEDCFTSDRSIATRVQEDLRRLYPLLVKNNICFIKTLQTLRRLKYAARESIGFLGPWHRKANLIFHFTKFQDSLRVKLVKNRWGSIDPGYVVSITQRFRYPALR